MTLPTGRNSDGTWVASTEAVRDAIGSNEGLAVGDRCLTLVGDGIHADREIDICASVDGANASTWTRYRRESYDSYWTDAAANVRFVPFGTETDRTLCSDPGVRLIAVGDGFVEKVDLESTVATLGSTDLDVVADATGDPTTGIGSTVTVNVDTADQAFAFVCGPTFAFSKDDRVGFSLDPTGNFGNQRAIVHLMVDMLTS